MNDAICVAVVDLLRHRPELFDPLKTAVDIEEEHDGDDSWKGWQWFDLPAQPQTLRSLVLQKVLKVRWKTRHATKYRLWDKEAVREALKLITILLLDINEPTIQTEEIPIDLFDDVVGYEDVKKIFFKSLLGEKEDRVHFLMLGPPASAKSLLLYCLERLPHTKYVMGSRTTKAGLAEYLIDYKPQHLLVDEMDKMNMEDYSILLSLCETGRITETIHGKNRDEYLDTIVFASANRFDGMPPEVISRFQPLHFNTYTDIEFMNVVEHVLTRRHFEPELARYIGEQVLTVLGSKDVRQALRVGKLAKNRRQVADLMRILYKYRGSEA